MTDPDPPERTTVSASGDVSLFIDPPSHHFLGDRLFDPTGSRFVGDDLLAPHRAVRDYFVQRGVEVHTADVLRDLPEEEDARRVYVSLGHLSQYRALATRADTIPSAFFVFECPIVEPSLYRALPDVARFFKRIYTWADAKDLVRFTRSHLATERFWWPQSFDEPHEELWSREDRDFLVMINTNKLPRVYWNELYTRRLEAVVYFQRFGEIDLYGRHWQRMPVRVGQTWVPSTLKRLHARVWAAWRGLKPHPVYSVVARASKGPVESKSDALSRYRFAVCFENMMLNGWITEKIFDCFFVGTVPVYLGAPDIQEWIPADCYIDMRRFSGFEALREYLHGLSEQDVEDYRAAARSFLGSERFEKFRIRAYVDLYRRLLEDDVGWRAHDQETDTLGAEPS